MRMRKVPAVVLTVLMLVGAMAAALPAFAATSEFDGTTSDTGIDLVITEVLINSSTHNSLLDDQVASGSVAVTSSPDAFDYIEIYNAGDKAVNMYDYSILSAPSVPFATGKVSTGLKADSAQYEFTNKNILVPLSIHNDNPSAMAPAGSLQTAYSNVCENPGAAAAILQPGQFCVIWFWTGDTDKVCKELGYSVGAGADGDDRYFPYFRNYYNIADDVLVLATNGKSGSATTDKFAGLGHNRTIALCYEKRAAEGEGDKYAGAWQLGTLAVSVDANGKKLDPRIVCMADWRTGNAVGIVTTDNLDDNAAYYVPANCTPHLYNTNATNAQPKNEDGTAKPPIVKKNYYEIDYVKSFKEVAMVTFTDNPSPGSMPAWQWAYIDAEETVAGEGVVAHGLPVTERKAWNKADLEITTLIGEGKLDAAQKDDATKTRFDEIMLGYVTDWTTNTRMAAEYEFVGAKNIKDTNGRLKVTVAEGEKSWAVAGVEDLVAKKAAQIEDGETGVTETKKDYSANFVDREVLEQRHAAKKGKGNKNEGGLPIWALILIIVGGVLLVGGGVVVAIILIKKKNKPVAADDVAAEGEVEVIDETAATEEAPVEEAAEEVAVEEAVVEEATEATEETQE